MWVGSSPSCRRFLDRTELQRNTRLKRPRFLLSCIECRPRTVENCRDTSFAVSHLGCRLNKLSRIFFSSSECEPISGTVVACTGGSDSAVGTATSTFNVGPGSRKTLRAGSLKNVAIWAETGELHLWAHRTCLCVISCYSLNQCPGKICVSTHNCSRSCLAMFSRS